jgi:hypothetical protein
LTHGAQGSNSDLFPGRKSSASPEATEVGDTSSIIHPYGVGIDCHSRFIQVCVLARREEKVARYEESFTTDGMSSAGLAIRLLLSGSNATQVWRRVDR